MLRLAKILANLYPDVGSAHRIMSDVGMEAGRILAETSPVNRWFAIVSECEKANLIPALVAVAQAEYPEHTALQGW